MKLNDYEKVALRYNNRAQSTRTTGWSSRHMLGLVAEVVELYELTNYIGETTNPEGMEAVTVELGDVMWNLNMMLKVALHSGISVYALTITVENLQRDYGDLTREDITREMVLTAGRAANIVERRTRTGRTERQLMDDWHKLDNTLTSLVGLLFACIRLHGVSNEFIAEHNIKRLWKRYTDAGLSIGE